MDKNTEMKTRKMWAVYQGRKLICIGTSRQHLIGCAGIRTWYASTLTDKELKEQYGVTVKQVNVTISEIKE